MSVIVSTIGAWRSWQGIHKCGRVLLEKIHHLIPLRVALRCGLCCKPILRFVPLCLGLLFAIIPTEESLTSLFSFLLLHELFYTLWVD